MKFKLYNSLINALIKNNKEYGNRLQEFIEKSRNPHDIKQVSELFFYYKKYLPQNDRKRYLKKIFDHIDLVLSLNKTSKFVYTMMHNDDYIPLYLGRTGKESRRFREHFNAHSNQTTKFPIHFIDYLNIYTYDKIGEKARLYECLEKINNTLEKISGKMRGRSEVLLNKIEEKVPVIKKSLEEDISAELASFEAYIYEIIIKSTHFNKNKPKYNEKYDESHFRKLDFSNPLVININHQTSELKKLDGGYLLDFYEYPSLKFWRMVIYRFLTKISRYLYI